MLVVIFFLLILMGVLGFAPIHMHENVNDKVLHFMTFCILSICLYYLWNLSFQRNLALTGGVLLVMAIGSEFIQGLLPVRHPLRAMALGGNGVAMGRVLIVNLSIFSIAPLTCGTLSRIYRAEAPDWPLPLVLITRGRLAKSTNAGGVVHASPWISRL